MGRGAIRGGFACVLAISVLALPTVIDPPGATTEAPPTESREIAVITWHPSAGAAGTPETETAVQASAPTRDGVGGHVGVASADPVRQAPTEPADPWVVSEPVPAGDAVLAGAEWVPDARVRVQLRSHGDGTWSDWHELIMTAGEGPDPEGPEGAQANWAASEPIWVGRVDELQVRVAGAGEQPELTLHTVDLSGDDGLEFTPREMLPRGDAAFASVSRPNFIPRTSWDPNNDCPARDVRYADSARYAIIHHTATTTDYSSSQSANIVRSICLYHRNTLGWDHIGYNVVVDKYGYVFEGRDGGVDRPVIGAHAAGFNSGSIGVSSIGCYDSSCSGTNTVWRSMLDAVDHVVAWKFGLHGIEPHDTTTETSGGSSKYPRGTEVTLPTIIGHRDVGHTACPGDNYYDYVDGRERMADRVEALMPERISIPRIAGSDRARTAVELSRWAGDDAKHVVIASSEAFPDGLAAGPLAGSLDAPVLLSPATHLPDHVADEVRRLGATDAWLVGGTRRLSEQVEADLAADAGLSANRIHRIAGGDRFATAGHVAWEVVGREDPDAAILAVGHHADPAKAFPDALSASALGAAYGLPVLLVERDRLPPETEWVLSQRAWPGGIYVIGGSGAISDDVVLEASVAARGAIPRRLAGPDRYATSVAVADEWRRRGIRTADQLLVATGLGWPDALAAGAAAARRDAAFLLVHGSDLDRSGASRDWIDGRRSEIDAAWAVGGPSAVSDRVAGQVAARLE